MKATVFALGLLLLIAACQPGHVDVRSPHWGKDTCAYCRMAVSSPPYAAQLVGPGGQVRFYDDLGCLIKDQLRRPELTKLDAYVTSPDDHQRWLRSTEARFGERLPTPMDFGFAPRNNGTLSFADVVSRMERAASHRGGHD